MAKILRIRSAVRLYFKKDEYLDLKSQPSIKLFRFRRSREIYHQYQKKIYFEMANPRQLVDLINLIIDYQETSLVCLSRRAKGKVGLVLGNDIRAVFRGYSWEFFGGYPVPACLDTGYTPKQSTSRKQSCQYCLGSSPSSQFHTQHWTQNAAGTRLQNGWSEIIHSHEGCTPCRSKSCSPLWAAQFCAPLQGLDKDTTCLIWKRPSCISGSSHSWDRTCPQGGRALWGQLPYVSGGTLDPRPGWCNPQWNTRCNHRSDTPAPRFQSFSG